MDFEQLRLLDLLSKFSAEIDEIYSARSLKNYNKAGADLQNIYNFLALSQNAFTAQQETFKNLFSAFNYGAVLVNDAIKSGGLKPDDAKLLNECMEIMIKCCSKLKKELS